MGCENPDLGLDLRFFANGYAALRYSLSADLGYRLFLRAVKAYLVPVPEDTELYDTVVALAERFVYPEELVRDGLVDLAD